MSMRGKVCLKSKKILIVEDETIIAMDIRNMLQGYGYSVCGIVSSGEESVRRAVEQKPDLILMDIRLKGKINGIKAAQIIRRTLDVPIVYMTAYGDAETHQEATRLKSSCLLKKPFSEPELDRIIQSLLNGIKKYPGGH